MDAAQLYGFVRRLDPDEATDVLGLADEATRSTVLRRLDEDRRETVAFLLGFSPESAAGLMDLDYVTVDADRPFGAVARRVRDHEERTGRSPTILVTDGDALLGELPGSTLATAATRGSPASGPGADGGAGTATGTAGDRTGGEGTGDRTEGEGTGEGADDAAGGHPDVGTGPAEGAGAATEAGPGTGEGPDAPVRRVIDHLRETPTVRYDTPDAEVLEVFRANPERSVAVLGDDGGVVGVIHAEDLLAVVEEEAGETLYEFTGVQGEESVLDGPLAKVRSRYRWLIVNLGTAFLAAAVVGAFEDTIAAFTLLAVYMPVVAGMGGNAGTQSMAVTVRGIALGQVSLATGGRVVGNEVLAGAANGAITGALVAVIAAVFNASPLLGLVLGVSMVLNLVIAGFFGTVIPLLLQRVGKDPATSATIFITTATDVLGFFIFLGLATVVLGL